MTVRCLAVTLSLILLLKFVHGIDNHDIDAELKVVDNIGDFILQNPNVTIMPMQVYTNPSRLNIVYQLGTEPTENKEILGYSDHWTDFDKPTNAQLHLSYPSNTNGRIGVLKYIYLSVYADTPIGGGYVVSGGLNQNAIKIVVEAGSTKYLYYVAAFVGSKD